MDGPERRTYKRSRKKLALYYRKIAPTRQIPHGGETSNVSPRGLYFRTRATTTLEPGNLVAVEVSIPPTAGVLEFGGKISGLARVLRAHRICDLGPDDQSPAGTCGVAVAFCQRPKLSM
jgi:hypothetical protein